MLNALTIATLLAATAAPAQSAAEANGPDILFSSTRDGNTDLYLMTADGSGERRLTTDSAADEIGRCSPDGRFVVFRRGGGQSGDLFRLDLNTGEELRLTDDPTRDSAAAWAPDGRTIFFTKRQDKFDRIARMGIDGNTLAFVTEGDWHDVVPSVSPDGRSLVFHTYRYGSGADLEVMNLAKGTSRRVTKLADGSFDYEPFFATNDEIVFSSNRDGGYYRLYVLSLGTGATRLLTDTGANAYGSRYSPATGYVLFFTGTNESWRIMRVPLTGGDATPVLAGAHSNSFPDWCPIGRKSP